MKQQCEPVWGRQNQAQAQAQGKANSWSTQQVQVQRRLGDFGYEYEGVSCTRPVPRSAAGWNPSLQVKQQNYQAPFNGSGSRPVLQGGSGVKRGCGGTGVFLPRQYVAPPPESRKKTSKFISTFYFYLFFSNYIYNSLLFSFVFLLRFCFSCHRLYSCFGSS